MKSALTICLLCISFSSLTAQIQKKTMILSSNIGVHKSYEEGSVGRDFTFSSQLGYCFNRWLALGAGVSMIKSNYWASEYTVLKPQLWDEAQYTIGFSPFLRFYPYPKGNIRFFSQLDIGLNIRDQYDISGTTYSVLGLGFGAHIFINNYVAFEPYIDYHMINGPTITTQVNNFGAHFGFSSFLQRDSEE